MTEIEYSVIIRTIGKAKEKYQKLLNSIDKLDPRPQEVIVVLPKGYDLPKKQLGYEHFCFSEKGMIAQRICGLNQCKTEYALFCDDDVEFDSSFIKYLYEPIQQGKAELSVGPLLSFLVPKGIKAFVSILTAGSYPTIFHKDKYITIHHSGAWSYNRNLDFATNTIYPTDSAAGTCFFGRTAAIKDIHFWDEMWVEKNGYAALEDQVMFYKAKLRGIRTVVASKAFYIHNDAQTSQVGIQSAVAYAGAFNRIVFWKRFIYDMQINNIGKMQARVALQYKLIVGMSYNHLLLLCGRMDKKALCMCKQGQRDAWEFLKSSEYSELRGVLE